MVRQTNKTHNFYTFFLGWKEHQKRQKKQQNQIVKRWKRRTDWKRGREKNSIFQDVCFLNPSLTFHQKRKKQGEEIHLTKLQTHTKKGNIVFEKGHSRKGNLTKNEFFEQKRTHRQEICNCVWKSQRQRKQNNTHKEKKTGKTKKETRTFKKRKERKTPANRKDEIMTEKSETKQKQHLQKVQEEVETAKTQGDNEKTTKKRRNTKKRRKSKTKKIMIKTEKKQKRPDQWQLFAHGDLTRPTTSRHAAMVNRAFNLKSWYFLTRKDYQNMRSGHFVAKAIFLVNFLRSSKKNRKGFQKRSKNDDWMTFFFIKLPKFRK